MAPGDRLPSLELVLDVLRTSREETRAHFDALDQKAGLALGFAGVLITLSRGVPQPWRTFGVLCAVGAGAFALGAFWPREYQVLDGVRDYLAAPEADTRLMLVDVVAVLNGRADRVVRRKTRRLETSLVAIGLAALMLGAGVTLAPEGGSDAGPGPRPVGSAAPAPTGSATPP